MFKLSVIYFFISNLFISSLIAQEEDPPEIQWVRYYQSEDFIGRDSYFYDIFAIPGGGYVCSGRIYTEVNRHRGWLLVTTEGGDVIHDLTFNFEGVNVVFTHGFSVIKTDDGGYLMGGRTQIGAVTQLNFDVMKINRNGETDWWEVITDGRSGIQCKAVIELKAGNYVVAGFENFQSYAALIDEDGEIIWENTFTGQGFEAIREIPGGGLLFAGHGWGGRGLLVKVDNEGEEIWNRYHRGGSYYNLISLRNGGFAASGVSTSQLGFFLARADDEGQLQWSRNYQSADSLRCIAFGLAEMPDGGLVMCGSAWAPKVSMVVRTDGAGNLRWQREYDELPNPFNERGHAREYHQVIVKADGSIVLGGWSTRLNRDGEPMNEGVMVCLAPDRSAPYITEYQPEMLEFSVLLGDSIDFLISANDLTDDSLLYYWTLDEDTVATDTFATITFNELGDHRVKAEVSDGELADSVAWMIEVEEFNINSYLPDSLNLRIQRPREMDFSLDLNNIEGVEPRYRWILTGHRGREEDIGDEADLTYTFDRGGDFLLEGRAYSEFTQHSVIWQIGVNSVLWWWTPHAREFSMSLNADTSFSVIPFNPDSDSLDFQWLVDGERLEESDGGIDMYFDSDGVHTVTAIVHDGAEVDTVVWTVTVNPNSLIGDQSSRLPTKVTLYPATPNPFNSTTSIRYFLPRSADVRLTVYDSVGRLVQIMSNGMTTAGEHRVTLRGAELSAGVYLLRLETGGKVNSKKVVLLK